MLWVVTTTTSRVCCVCSVLCVCAWVCFVGTRCFCFYYCSRKANDRHRHHHHIFIDIGHWQLTTQKSVWKSERASYLINPFLVFRVFSMFVYVCVLVDYIQFQFNSPVKLVSLPPLYLLLCWCVCSLNFLLGLLRSLEVCLEFVLNWIVEVTVVCSFPVALFSALWPKWVAFCNYYLL